MVTAEVETEQIELIKGDITLLEVDALVFYAEPNLELGSGFGTAISIRGGPTIKKELEELGPLETGEADMEDFAIVGGIDLVRAVKIKAGEFDALG